jgi:hypothetical protein
MGMNSLVHQILTRIGVNPARFNLRWASAAEAPRFVKLITEFTQKIKDLGPLGYSEGIEPAELRQRLQKALAVVSDRKVRMSYGNAVKTIRKDGQFTQEYIDAVMVEKLAKTLTAAFESEPSAEKEAEGEEAKPSATKKAPVEEKKNADHKETAPPKKITKTKVAAKPAKKTAAKKNK